MQPTSYLKTLFAYDGWANREAAVRQAGSEPAYTDFIEAVRKKKI
jgi:hypothetical protein